MADETKTTAQEYKYYNLIERSETAIIGAEKENRGGERKKCEKSNKISTNRGRIAGLFTANRGGNGEIRE